MSNGTNSLGNEPFNGTSDTHFGSSVESAAQMHDAASASTVIPGEMLGIYKLVPIAAPDDPNWNNAPGYGEVIVAARTTGDARIVASSHELDFMEIDAAPAEGVTTSHASAFRSEKLYTVIEMDRGRTDLTRGVLHGTIGVDNIKPTQV
ncbi:hypothetical protein [Pararhizobium sp.]|uniref:hypothetical protein n=1 Tax=Pararhizobium sp. TaxID=1977563 RepID=UPI00271C729F|nr:hypothetical protein [Pararhizobium sp.]MDO9418487.1 hypothetical protein [Pararhizobium sp.]